MEPSGFIFDIQSFSVHDGPGCRTSIFFSGCPLRCKWCANPESWTQKMQIMVAENVCKWEKGCRVCKDVCPNGSLFFDEEGKCRMKWDICRRCDSFDCVSICPNNAFKQCVKEYSVAELAAVLKRDFNNWGPDGGVTFTGGEPLMSAPFLGQMLDFCRERGIHTAIETSAHANEALFLEMLQKIDFAFIDVKHMDRQLHKQGTGVYNDQILSNIAALKRSGWKGRLVLRQPTIGGFNDQEANALDLIDFMEANGLFEINLLKFHRLGETKWDQLGREYEYQDTGDVSQAHLEQLQDIYLKHDIACYVGDHTPF